MIHYPLIAFQKINRHPSNKAVLIITIILILSFSSLPFWLGRYYENDAQVFIGTYFDTPDYSVHMSMMNAGYMGEWAYQMRFTSEEHAPAYIRLFYVLLGNISRLFGIKAESLFHIARWLFGSLALASIYQLCSKILVDRNLAFFAFILATTGAGIGWLQVLLGAPLKPISPIDLWFISGYILFSISLFPSFSLTIWMMVTALTLFLEYLETGKKKNIVLICLLSAVCQVFNPIAFATIDLAMAGAVFFQFWGEKKIATSHISTLMVMAATQIPLLVYNYLILKQDPIWSQFTLQNKTLSPMPIYYLWGYFPFWIFFIIGAWKSFKENKALQQIMFVWVASGFALAYLPVQIQRRFLFGITIPLSILAVYGLEYVLLRIADKFKGMEKRKPLIYFIYTITASISTFIVIFSSSAGMSTHPALLYYPRDLKNAVSWLDKNSQPNEFVLANITTSQIVAQNSDLKVFTGHEMETLFFENKNLLMKAYFQNTASNNWLSATPIQWVIYGPYEREINPDFIPDENLGLIYKNSTVRIYKVVPYPKSP